MFLLLVFFYFFQWWIIQLQLNGLWLLWLFFFWWIVESSKYAFCHWSDFYLTRLLDSLWLHFFRMQIWWRINLLIQIWIMSRTCDETCQTPLFRVFRRMEKGLGNADAISLLHIMWGWKSIIPHSCNLTEGPIIMEVGRWGQQPQGSERWLW